LRRIIFFRVAGKNIHIPKLIGSFVIFAALLMFIQASASMFDSWDNMKYYEDCIQNTDTSQGLLEQRTHFNVCADTLYKSTGIVVREDTARLTARQFWSGLLSPIAALLFWLASIFIGFILYRTGELVLPIEETVREVPDVPRRSFRKK